MKKKIWSIMLAICFGVLLLPVQVFAEETTDVWDGIAVADAYESGDGTEESPYEIATAAQFAYFAEQISQGIDINAYYVLSANLDMSAKSWETIGRSYFQDYFNNRYFAGSFDGQGHSITYQITEKQEGEAYSAMGLFGFAEGEISNLVVEGTITLSGYVEASWIGGLCGLFAGNMTNCASGVDIILTNASITNSCDFGGLTGEFQAGTMEECLYRGTMRLQLESMMGDLYTGGLSGAVFDGTISACKNEGTLTLEAQGGCTGGIVGLVYTYGAAVTSRVTDCYNTGNISANSGAGGIAGQVVAVLDAGESGEAVTEVLNCYSSGTITGNPGKAISVSVSAADSGGGNNAHATVESCYYTTGEDDYGVQVTKDKLYEEIIKNAEEGMWIKDANGNVRLYWEFTVNAMPEAAFTANGDASGTLSGVSAGMKYSVDNGSTWHDILDTVVNIEGVTAANGIQIYEPGDNLTTLDSEIQTISVMQAGLPEVGKVDCTTAEQNDGQLVGVDNTMEYRQSANAAWTTITGNTVTGLEPGTYYVRVKADGQVLASPAVEIVIEEHVCSVGDSWNSDENNHWKACGCGEVFDKTTHSFVWVVDKEATAAEAGAGHEECKVCGYKKAAVEIPAMGTSDKPGGATSPKTGDGSYLTLWISLFAVTGVALIGIVLHGRRRNYNK